MAPTGTLDVVTPMETTTLSWNGEVEDREAARNAFDALMKGGFALAVVFDGEDRGHQVRSFTEIEEVERERGVVHAQISPALIGG